MIAHMHWSDNSDVINIAIISLVLGTGALAGAKKYALSVIVGCALIMVTLNTSKRQNLLVPTGGADPAPSTEDPNPDAIDDIVVVDEDKGKPRPIADFAKGRDYDDAVHENVIRSEDPGLSVDNHVVTVLEDQSQSMTGQSKYMFDQKFTPLPSQMYKPVISTSFSDQKKGERQPTAKGLQELLARQQFYDTMASGGDIEPRVPSGIQTMRYLASSHPK